VYKGHKEKEEALLGMTGRGERVRTARITTFEGDMSFAVRRKLARCFAHRGILVRMISIQAPILVGLNWIVVESVETC
jgi:hypothetical protein